MVNGRHPIQKWKFFSLNSLFALAIFYPRHTLLSSRAQKPPAFKYCMWRAYRERRVESLASVFFARSLRCPIICRQTPTTLIKTPQRRDKIFAARARPLARALIEVFPRSLSRPIGLSLSPTRSFTFSTIGIGGQRRPGPGEAAGRVGKWRGCRQSLAAE